MMVKSIASKRRQERATARIDARLTPEQKAVIQHAADLQSRSISEFVIETASAAAERTIREHEIITLSAEESVRFAEALLNPPEPSERLCKAAQQYRTIVAE